MVLATSVLAAMLTCGNCTRAKSHLLSQLPFSVLTLPQKMASIPYLGGCSETRVKPSYHLTEANEMSSGIHAGLHLGDSAVPTSGLVPATLGKKCYPVPHLSSQPLRSWQPVMHMSFVVLFVVRSFLETARFPE